MIEDLKVFHGYPVPWVARWSGEVQDRPMQYSIVEDEHKRFPLIRYADGEHRDEHGILWQRDGLSRRGTPEFGQVNTTRQVASMKKRICQVCGEKIESDVTLFLAIDLERVLIDSTHQTTTPPVCEECSKFAPTVCPALKKGYVTYEVREYKPVAVFGQVFALGERGVDSRFMDVPLGNPAMRACVGKQLAVEFTDYEMKED